MITKITNDELLMDIKNTELECKAYHQLFSGYMKLFLMPEATEIQLQEYTIKIRKNFRAFLECKMFLKALYELENEQEQNSVK